ncbi:MAG: hypothetical protein RBG13Loki_1353 [Promethearchaeota archaeon CR_4]|nr:MAG: hypothetical protein RBG13Loki_1353 [Candidatus Lokiarchaeota archaeon CR_4]
MNDEDISRRRQIARNTCGRMICANFEYKDHIFPVEDHRFGKSLGVSVNMNYLRISSARYSILYIIIANFIYSL